MPIEIVQKILLALRDGTLRDAGFHFVTSKEHAGTWSRWSAPYSMQTGGEWTTITHVCRALRDLALSSPDLWTVIDFQAGFGWALAAEKRSRHLPLTIAAYRTRLGMGGTRTKFNRLLDRILPRLEAMSLGEFPPDGEERLSLPDVVLRRPAPMLMSVELRYPIICPWQPCALFCHVRRLRLEHADLGHRYQDKTPFLCEMLKQMPLLEDVTLIMFPGRDYGIPGSVTRGTTATHPALIVLLMDNASFPALLTLLSEVSLPRNVLDISFDTSRRSQTQRYLPQLVSHLKRFWEPVRHQKPQHSGDEVVQHVTVRRVILYSGDQEIIVELDRPRDRKTLRLHCKGDRLDHMIEANTAASANLLSLHATTQMRVSDWRVLLPLTSLVNATCRTLIIEAADMDEDTELSMPPDGVTLESRALERVVLVGMHTGSFPEPETIVRWLQRREQAGMRRLKTLIYRGCRELKDTQPLAAMKEIEALVDNLQWEGPDEFWCVSLEAYWAL
jgi:hypothetical protein